MHLLDLLLVTVLSWPVHPGETDQEYTCIIILWETHPSSYIYLIKHELSSWHQSLLVLTGGSAASGTAKVVTISSLFFSFTHHFSFLDIISVPCPLSASFNSPQSHIDLHDTLPDVLFSLSKLILPPPPPPHTHTTPHTDTPTLPFPRHLSLVYTHIRTTTQPRTWASLILPDSLLESLYIWWSLLALSFYQDLHDAGSVLR